ncbi:hypothetical protein [Streptomyces sp. ADI98-10]|uniref:hypothetical protein n=1 Tax=Streptomyces sp. ADI98-10 TaxID=1522763 RepID=UPI000F5571E8|nr:hypothetical protein [Streptomyces sp. ADI98-10]RPK92770.1 hypothetical protein EES46_07980 [Streptomyces sp. ADI98-10]
MGFALLTVGGVLLRSALWWNRRRAPGTPAVRAAQITVPTAATALAVGTAVTGGHLPLAAAGCAATWTSSVWPLRRPARERTT